GGTPLGHLRRPPAQQRLEDHEQVGRAVAHVLVVVAGWLPRRGRQRHAGLADQLHRHLVEADQRPPGVVGAVVDFQHVLHPGYELPALPRRDDPLLLEVGLKFVFLSTRRTVSSLTDSKTSNSTSLSASSFSVQRARPSGGWEQARAISRASAAPSNFRSRLGRPWGLRPSAGSKPRSTNHWRTRSTVRRPQSRAPAIWASSQAGPPGAWSAFRRMRARVRVRADRLPAEVKAVRRSRSSGVKV